MSFKMSGKLSRKELLIVTFWMIISCVFAENYCSSETFAISLLYNNMKPEYRPVKVANATNRMECSTHCYRQGRCTGFIISSAGSVCSLYDRRYKAMTFVNESGTQTYELISGEPLDCYDVSMKGFRSNGVYTVKPTDSGQTIKVSCEASSPLSGWLVIQRRADGSEDFNRNWSEYRNGFGDLNNECWLGNTNIHRITSQGYYDLKIDLEDFHGKTRYALYKNFSVSSEDDFFRLSIGAYSGDAGDSLSAHNGKNFSTMDVDLDEFGDYNCAKQYKGAWWFHGCINSVLNGLYINVNRGAITKGIGVIWKSWLGKNYSLEKTVMKIRPMEF